MMFNKQNIKNPLDEKNEAFMQASDQATDEYLDQNQDNPMAFMDVLKGSIVPPQEPQIPFAPQDRSPSSVDSQDTLPDNLAQEEALNQAAVSPTPPDSPNSRSNYDRILQELKAIRSGADANIQNARKADSQNELSDSLSRSANTIGNAFANRSGRTNVVKPEAISLKSNLSAQAEGDRNRKLEDLMSEYKMINDKENKDEDRKYKKQMLDLQKAKINSKIKPMSKGQEALDREFAKEVDKYTSSGRVNALSSINKLEQIASDLEKEGDGMLAAGAGRTSVLPDALRSKDSVKWRDNAITSANSTLKELFGAQLSDSERESAAKEFYNDSLSNKENAQILKSKVQSLKSGLQNKDTKAKHFLENGTLQGLTPSMVNNSQPSGKTIAKKQYSPSANKTKITYSDGTEEILDGK